MEETMGNEDEDEDEEHRLGEEDELEGKDME